jgi:RNA methyltransferase, TrmH family
MLSAVKIKYLHSLKVKKYRKKYSVFIAEGRKVIQELAAAGLPLKELYLLDTAIGNWEVELFRQATVITDAEMKKISNLSQPGEALAVFSIPAHEISQINTNDWILMLDDIQDPGNMGTIIRTADWFGIPTILCSDGCVDAYNPKVVQASMASIGRVAVLETDIREYLRSHQNIAVYGAVLDEKSYLEQDFQNKGILLIGNEGHGIHPETAKYIQFPITIPRNGKAESLNAAIAAALICAKACI